MPEVVEADGGEASPLEQWFVVAVHDVLSVYGRTVPGGEHETLISVQGTSGNLLLWLAPAVALEGAHCPLGEPHGAAAGVLGLGEPEAAPAPDAL